MSELGFEAARLVHWCRDEALPLWAKAGVAPDGGFYERLLGDGTPDRQADRRFRVQCRQVVVFGEAALRNWHPQAREIALNGLDFCLSRVSWTPFEGAPLVLDASGSVSDPKVDLYTHAFLLLALSYAIRLDAGRDRAIACADAVIDFLDRKMASPHGGWVEALPPVLPRRQNPHMHLLEAFLGLFEASGKTRFLSRAGDMVALFDRHFYRLDAGVMTEFFEDDWAAHARDGDIVEPGHMMEWAWLLDRYARASATDRRVSILTLYDRARELGTDPVSGFLVDEIDVSGAPVTPKRRSWAQTEYIKAALIAARFGRMDGAEEAAGRINALLATYLGTDAPVRGGWVDRYDASGVPTKDINSASTFYHFIGAVADAAGLDKVTRP